MRLIVSPSVHLFLVTLTLGVNGKTFCTSLHFITGDVTVLTTNRENPPGIHKLTTISGSPASSQLYSTPYSLIKHEGQLCHICHHVVVQFPLQKVSLHFIEWQLLSLLQVTVVQQKRLSLGNGSLLSAIHTHTHVYIVGEIIIEHISIFFH